MSLRLILLAGIAMTALSGVARADDTYRCGDSICRDDQADETRRLNEMQLENPGAGMDAVPGADDSYDPADDNDDADGQGGPYSPVDPSDDSASGSCPPDSADQPDDNAYPDEDFNPDAAIDDSCVDDEDAPYPDESDD